MVHLDILSVSKFKNHLLIFWKKTFAFDFHLGILRIYMEIGFKTIPSSKYDAFVIIIESFNSKHFKHNIMIYSGLYSASWTVVFQITRPWIP